MPRGRESDTSNINDWGISSNAAPEFVYTDELPKSKTVSNQKKKIINEGDYFVVKSPHGKLKSEMIVRSIEPSFQLKPGTDFKFNVMEIDKGIKEVISYDLLEPIWWLKEHIETKINDLLRFEDHWLALQV